MAMRRFDPETFLQHVGSGKTVTAYRSGAIIVGQGSRADLVFYLQSGRAKEAVMSEQGKGAIVRVLEQHMFFGISAVYSDAPLMSTVTAINPCVVTAIEAEAMRAALKQTKFAELFMVYLLRHNTRLEIEKTDLLFDNSERLLAKRLLMLAHFGEEKTETIGPEITQDMLAEMIGTTRPRVNYFLNKFRKLGLIKYNGGIKVLPGLAQLAATRTEQDES